MNKGILKIIIIDILSINVMNEVNWIQLTLSFLSIVPLTSHLFIYLRYFLMCEFPLMAFPISCSQTCGTSYRTNFFLLPPILLRLPLTSVVSNVRRERTRDLYGRQKHYPIIFLFSLYIIILQMFSHFQHQEPLSNTMWKGNFNIYPEICR